ncbi:SixA phosphatase family protein [Phyllobacterium zundukense]|uniref:Histidine phosphatase family protein n=1 Tax=Phyllobacterium zundukense TaxID=1867719 RepID=A0ACD4DAJ5_9HYPH|nr:histidine phosphatase family protein [Phyllobacterium zundukense]UXN62794.1 histidine phosphatase family protein [Phyllobacterium zundukense]
MRRLMLLRHAKSGRPDNVDDHARPLAERGRRECPLMGIYMVEQGLLPDLAIISTARRTMETWELIRTAFPKDITQIIEARLYDASAKAILDVIHETPPDVKALLVAGHNPGLHDLALGLIRTGSQHNLSRLQQKYPTAALAVIDFGASNWKVISEGTGQLERFVTPKSISGLSGLV